MDDWRGSERRRSTRRTMPCKIYVYTPKKHVISSCVENISGVGVRVVLDERLDPGTKVDVEVYMGDDMVRCNGKVVWVREGSGPVCKDLKCGATCYDTGIEIESPDLSF